MVRGSGSGFPSGQGREVLEPFVLPLCTGTPPVRWGAVQRMGRSGGRRWEGMVIGDADPRPDDVAMQILARPGTPRPRALAMVVSGTVAGSVLVFVGLAIAYLVFATPLVERLVPAGRPSAGQTVAGMFAWSVALIGPAVFVLVGTARLARVLDDVGSRGRSKSVPSRHARALPAETVLATGVDLGDGRPIPELVVGPFGAAVIRELPPPALTRQSGGRWELRTRTGWLPIENPLERAARDAERVRRWFSDDDNDFLIKVYASVIVPAPGLVRTSACAVLTADQLPAWLASLPAQRSLTPSRRERLMEMVRTAV